jgi:cyclophilin family peptidyl-prolyl cis-trans isomerase
MLINFLLKHKKSKKLPLDTKRIETIKEEPLIMNADQKKEENKILVTLGTSLGELKIEMDSNKAPKTVKHMKELFEFGHYLGAGIFRVGQGHAIQIGDFDCDLYYRTPPGGPIELESEGAQHIRGTVGLNRGEDLDSGHSTFFINMINNFHLNPSKRTDPNTTGYAVFGRIVEGLDILDAMVKSKKSPSLSPDGTPCIEDAEKYPVVVTSILVQEV